MKAWIVDTFAEGRYKGNPASVIWCPDGHPSAERMQAIAFELGQPTTAFLVNRGDCAYAIRWFTPEQELNICGHATIASAGYLFATDKVPRSAEICFHTQSGLLRARQDGPHIFLTLPRMDISRCPPPAYFQQTLGSKILFCAKAIDDLLVEVESERAVSDFQPDFEAMKPIACRGHIVTARASQTGADFVTRTFFPALGVPEDQVCVSAHCKLGPYWSHKLGKDRLTSLQLSARGGRLVIDVEGDNVNVAGTATIRGSVDVERRSEFSSSQS